MITHYFFRKTDSAIGDEGIEALMIALGAHCPKLQSLCLQGESH
jgi:hypothetical protein